jgi:hypothetical protein
MPHKVARCTVYRNSAMLKVFGKFHHPVVVFVGYIFSAVNSGLCVLSIPSLRKFLKLITPSKPQQSIFLNTTHWQYMYNGMSRELWCVINGRAAAPPE